MRIIPYCYRVVCGTSLETGLVVYAPTWPDTHIPRTARPVRFIPRAPASSKARTRHPSLSFDSFTIRWT